jgi:iron complex transport system substrate-binding protein
MSRGKLYSAIILTAVLITVALGALVWRRTDLGQGKPHSGLRLVSLAPNITETLFALGAGDEVVGVTNYCNYPPAALTKPKVGDFVNPSIETIVALKPDLVLMEYWRSSKTARRLAQLGIPFTETVSPMSLQEVYQLIDQVGKSVRREAEAERLIAKMKRRIEAVRARTSRFPYHPSVYVEIDPPSWTVGKGSYTSEAIALAGGRNLFDDLDRPASLVSKEEVVKRDPDVILSFWAKADQIRSRPGWESIKAVREGRIIDDFNRDLLSRGSPRLVEGIERLADRLEALRETAISPPDRTERKGPR